MAWNSPDLVSALRRQVLDLEADLRARVDGDDHSLRQPGVWQAWESDYNAAFAAQRTAATWSQWRDERVTQAAVAWVLLTVFARYCEDNALVSPRWIGGADADQRTQALDARRAYFQAHPEHTDREWLGEIISHFDKFSATSALVDSFSPLHMVSPSGDAARALLEFWWQQGDDGQPIYTFNSVDTRFLGDAYQDLSEYAKKTYALLQTPDFVEEFILDQTLEPALADRPLEGFSVIDPTCGSGHFLLGAFHRLHRQWQRHAPGLGARQLVARALDSVYGVDINPAAIAIARFRLLVAALQAAGDANIEQNIGYSPHLAAGDSLLWGARDQLALDDGIAIFGTDVRADGTENASALKEILQRDHDVVVGNPPYITPKDAALNTSYRQLYRTPHMKYALTVPFMELFFRLGYPAGASRPAGWIGQITSNSFMKREFGTKLIEQFLSTVDLRTVIDASGAYIPGHGTPTVILVGRNQPPTVSTVRAVLGSRGEPDRPNEPAKGVVWTSITEHLDEVGFENTFVSITDLPRATLNTHPWSLSGGGAVELLETIDAARARLSMLVERIGFVAITAEDEAFFLNDKLAAARLRVEHTIPMIEGLFVRDFAVTQSITAVWPYDTELQSPEQGWLTHLLWPLRRVLQRRKRFGTPIEDISSLRWWEFGELYKDKLLVPLSIAFAFVATHNHFVLDRGGKVFKQSAPVIKLPQDASVDDHLQLLGVLNSSVACFWLKQNSHDKGGGGIGGGIASEDWEKFYEFTGTTLRDFPLPANTPLDSIHVLDKVARQLQDQTPAAVAARGTPSRAALDSARQEFDRLRSLMIAQQEELDWEYYRIYDLIDGDLTYSLSPPGIALGERAFEIALARLVRDGEHTAWFDRHGSTPITEVPSHLPADYQALLQRRLDAIASNPHLRLLERPEFKRRWTMEPWDKQVEAALREWLLDQVEDRALWYDRDGRPSPRSVAQLADLLDRDSDFREVLRLWAGDPNAATGTTLAKLLADEAVPFLAAYRYKPSGLDKRADWEHTWTLQRREDAGEKLDTPIPVPPKYKPVDFAKPAYWSHRGKLDIPKERFISYPNAGRDTDPTELLGWAGWDHAEQALALASLISARTEEGWDTPRLIPLLAGLHELAPWVRQWHNEVDPEYGESVADTIDTELAERLAEHHLTTTDLTTWRPALATRGRRARTS